MLFFVIGLVAIVVLIVFVVIGMYNRLVSLRNLSEQAWSDVDVQLTRRHDLIGNLVETVKGYAGHERETLEKVIQARAAATSAQGPADKAQAEGFLTQALRGLLAVAEAYPELKADANFRELQRELTATEDRIAGSRQVYNATVREYDTARETFPTNIIAGMFNFEAREYYEADDPESRQPVEVDFS
jgi:LemA protein